MPMVESSKKVPNVSRIKGGGAGRVGTNPNFEKLARRMYRQYLHGATLAEVGRSSAGRSAATILNIFKRRGWRTRPQPTALRRRLDKIAADLYKIYLESGWSAGAISELCGMSENWLRDLFIRRELRMRRPGTSLRGRYRLSAERARAIRRAYMRGNSLAVVGEKYGISSRAVQFSFRCRGLRCRTKSEAAKLRSVRGSSKLL
jgi:hypothetical protein